MHIVDFVFSVIDKFTPMEQSQKTELREDARIWYLAKRDKVYKAGQNKIVQDGFDVKKANLTDKVIYWAEHWGVRTALAILWIIAVPMIQDMHEGGTREDKDDHDF